MDKGHERQLYFTFRRSVTSRCTPGICWGHALTSVRGCNPLASALPHMRYISGPETLLRRWRGRQRSSSARWLLEGRVSIVFGHLASVLGD